MGEEGRRILRYAKPLLICDGRALSIAVITASIIPHAITFDLSPCHILHCSAQSSQFRRPNRSENWLAPQPFPGHWRTGQGVGRALENRGR